MLTLQDRYPPSLDSTRSVIVSSNAYVELFASEGLYTNAAGNAPLNAADFAVVFDRNGGNATGADIAQVRKVGGSALSGNEDSLWVYINVTETPNGLERVRIEAEDTDAIYDDNGNVKGEVKGSGRILAGMIQQINQHIQKKYSIGKPVFLDVPKHQDFGKMKKKFLLFLLQQFLILHLVLVIIWKQKILIDIQKFLLIKHLEPFYLAGLALLICCILNKLLKVKS